MIIELKQAAGLLRRQDNILILTHANPDGDTLGSAAALCLALQSMGKRARIENADAIPAKYDYLFAQTGVETFAPDFIMAVDVADKKLLGSLADRYDDIKLSIDHHGSNRLFASQTAVDATSSSTAELILELIGELDVPVTKQIANAVYTGLATDTGCFRFLNTTARTHLAAAKMMEAGADVSMINKRMFETKSFSYLKLERIGLEGLTLHFGGRVAVICLTQKDFRESGASQQDCEGICGIPRQIEGVDIGVTMREKEDGIYKISVRSNEPYDAAAICQRMGGGGHKGAAGCEIEGTPERVKELLLENIGEVLRQMKEEKTV